MKSIRNDLESLKEKRGQVASHPGLLLQRYLHKTAAGEDGDPKQKQDILQAAIKASANSETQQLYKTAFDRWQKCLPKESTQSSTLQTVGRLIVGLGTENVFETGIRLHHTYGMPVLPGSALKGLAAHYCDQIWGERDNPNASDIAKKWRAPRNKDQRNNPDGEDQGSFHKLFFGATDDAGCVIFHDGWFVPGSSKEPLKLDVMTPHHSGWNNVVNPQAPTDFDSPIPVPFVSVSGQFFVAVTWRGPKDEKQAWKWFFQRAIDCLREALFHWGIGGKTSSGYGFFDLIHWKEKFEKEKKEAETNAALESMTEIQRSIKDFIEKHTNKQQDDYMKLLIELKNKNGKWTDDKDRREVAEIVKTGMKDKKKWEKNDKSAEHTKFIKEILGEK